MTETQLTASRQMNAAAADIFKVLSSPARHRDFDGSSMIVAGDPDKRIEGVGEIFTMEMHHATVGDYRMDNTVVSFVPDERIAWAPAPAGQEPSGHTFTYTLEAHSPHSTTVTLTHDWSDFRLDWVDRLPIISQEALERSLDLLAEAVA